MDQEASHGKGPKYGKWKNEKATTEEKKQKRECLQKVSKREKRYSGRTSAGSLINH